MDPIPDGIFKEKPFLSEAALLSFSSQDFYWELKIPRETIREFNRRVLNGEDFFTCLKEMPGLDPNYTLDSFRGDFLPMIPFHRPTQRRMRILDLGSGFGNITLRLARLFPEADIVAADASKDILQMLSLRLQAEGVHNVICCHIDALEKKPLPFGPDTFDLILLNGVLEWIGASVSEGDPRDHQVRVLAHLKTLLSPTGTLYIGIENGTFIGYYLGVRDPHSGLRFTSVVPKWVANRISLWKRRRPYRTYLYSPSGFQALFADAGFMREQVRTSFVWASYKDPHTIIPTWIPDWRKKLRTLEIFPTWRSRWLFRVLSLLHLDLFFAPSFLFYLSRGANQGITTAVLELQAATSALCSDDWVKIMGGTRSHGMTTFLSFKAKQVAKINRSYPASADLRRFSECFPDHLLRVGRIGYVAPYLDGQILTHSVTRRLDPRIATFISATHAQLHHASGCVWRHGDCTSENLLLGTDGQFHFIDWDNVTTKDPQIFDIFDYLLHTARIERRLSAMDTADWLLSAEVSTFLAAYEQGLSLRGCMASLIAYLEKMIIALTAERPKQAAYYRDISSSLQRLATYDILDGPPQQKPG